jgi:hypothetical protein
MKFKTLDDARIAYINNKITAQEFSVLLGKFAVADQERKNIEKSAKKIERKLSIV